MRAVTYLSRSSKLTFFGDDDNHRIRKSETYEQECFDCTRLIQKACSLFLPLHAGYVFILIVHFQML